MSQAELARRLAVEPPTVTNMVRRLEALGLLGRRGDATDARLVRVYLNPKGHALEGPLRELWQSCVERLVAGLSLEERLLMRRLLLHMRANVA